MIRFALAVLCLCTLVSANDLLFTEDTIVPEHSLEEASIYSVPLLRSERSSENHARLVKWIGDTHERKVHPVRLIHEGAQTQKLVSEVKLQNADMVEYYGVVQVGEQKFKTVYDTGSGILWVPGAKCVEEACRNHHRLKLADGIALDQGEVSIKYGTGHMSGQRATATVHTAGVKVKDQTFLMSTEEHGQVFQQGKFDGVFGMGRKKLSVILSKPGDKSGRTNPFYMNAIKQQRLKTPEFSFYVSATNGKPGAVVFGGTNPKLYKGAITMHPGRSEAYWMMDIQAMSVHQDESDSDPLVMVDTSDAVNSGDACLRGIADTGTSLLVGPPQFIRPLLEHVNVHPDCSNLKDLKTVRIAMLDVNGKKVNYHLAPKDYVMKRQGTCKTGIAIMNLQLPGTHPTMILGDTFLRKYYSVYNHEKNQIGFALADHEDQGIPQLAQGTN